MKNKKMLTFCLILLFSTITITAVSAESLIVKPTSEDSNIHWEFTGTDNPDYKAGYEFALISQEDGQTYWLGEDQATEMWEKEPAMFQVDKRLNDFENSEDLKYGFEFPNTNTMEIEYSTGNTIGAYNDARVINHIKINGEEVF